MKAPKEMPDTLKFSLGDRVNHKAGDEDDGKPGVITGITFRQSGVSYEVAWGPHAEGSHCELELEHAGEGITT